MTTPSSPGLMAVLLCGLALLGACSGKSRDFDVLPASDDLPQADNLSWGSRAAIDAFIRFSSWRGERSGYIVLFARDGVPVYSNAAGWKNIERREPMTVDTHVRIASMTEPVTAVAAMILVEENTLSLDDPVSRHLPEFAAPRVATSQSANADGSFPTRPARREILVRDLLMFSSGIGPGLDRESALARHWEDNGIHARDEGDLAQRVSRLAQLPLFEDPGTRWRYGYSADVLAAIVEKVSGKGIGEFMRERIFEPLGMDDTRYELPAQDRAQLATIYTQDADGHLVAVPSHYSPDWQPGGDGLVSTADDYMRFALMLWSGGEYRDTRILQQSTVDNMRRLHVPDGVLAGQGIEGIGWGLGMAVVADADASTPPDRDGDFWWAGYYGTTFIVSPSTGLVGVVMTQNKPGEFSGIPYQVYVVQGIAFAGL